MTHLDTLRSARDIAWGRYKSTVITGGTPEQRRWACDQAVRADDRVAELERLTVRP